MHRSFVYPATGTGPGRTRGASVVFVGLAVVLPSVGHAGEPTGRLDDRTAADAPVRPVAEEATDRSGLLGWVAEAARHLGSVATAVAPEPVLAVVAHRPLPLPALATARPLPPDPSIPGRGDLPPPHA